MKRIVDVYVLDQDLNQVGIVDNYTSLIWANRYNEDGDCELYIEATDNTLELLKKGYYLIRLDDDMVCRIETIELDTDVENGNYLIVHGYDVKKILNQRIIWSQTNVDGLVEDYIRDIIYRSLCNPALAARQIRNSKGEPIFFLGNRAGFTEVTSEQVTYQKVGDKVQELCKSYNWGYKVIADTGKFYFILYKGTDRSNDVIFSNDYENLSSTKYKEDSSDLANVALVGGEGEGSERARNVSGYSEGINRNEIFVDAKDISRTITWEELTSMYPTTDQGGKGHIDKTTVQQAIVYRMDAIDIFIVDSNQLTELKVNYPNGQEITKNGHKYYQIYNVIIADLTSDTPQPNDNVILRDLVYSVYLLNRGYDAVNEHGTIVSFEGSVEPDITFKYKEDYFLGDEVTVQNEYGITVVARIVEVIETYDQNGYSIEPKFEYIEVDKPTKTVSYLLTENGERIVTESDEFLVLESNGIFEKSEIKDSNVVEYGSKKISELPETDDAHESVLPIVVNGETRKVTYNKLKEHLDAEIGGSRDYEELQNKPQINDVTLVGNKAFKDLNLNPVSNLEIEDIFKN